MSDVVPVTRRIYLVVVVAVLVAGLAGCQTTAGRRPGRAASSAGPEISFSPSPAPSGYAYSGPAEGMERRTVAPDGLLGLGLRVGEDSAGSDVLSPCGDPETLFEWLGLGYWREWESGQDTTAWTYVKQYTRPFFRDGQVIPGTQVVAEVKRRTTCGTYNSREGTSRLTGELVLPALLGVWTRSGRSASGSPARPTGPTRRARCTWPERRSSRRSGCVPRSRPTRESCRPRWRRWRRRRSLAVDRGGSRFRRMVGDRSGQPPELTACPGLSSPNGSGSLSVVTEGALRPSRI